MGDVVKQCGCVWQTRSKYEVKESGATEFRRHDGRRQSKNDVWELNPCTREVEAPLVRKASVTRMGISIAAFFENFIEANLNLCSGSR